MGCAHGVRALGRDNSLVLKRNIPSFSFITSDFVAVRVFAISSCDFSCDFGWISIGFAFGFQLDLHLDNRFQSICIDSFGFRDF